MLLGTLLREELDRRRARNRRYSLRAFARDLGVHHATLSRIVRGRQQVTMPTLTRLASALHLAPERLHQLVLAEAEAAVLRALGRRDFRPESRWIAALTSLSVDEVNAAIHRLLRQRRMRMASASRWVVTEDGGA